MLVTVTDDGAPNESANISLAGALVPPTPLRPSLRLPTSPARWLTTVSLQVSAIDAEGDGLTYVATGLPAGLSINATGLISGDIATGADTSSPYTVLVTVTDDGAPNESANISFGWSVSAANTAPTITSIQTRPVSAARATVNGRLLTIQRALLRHGTRLPTLR